MSVRPRKTLADYLAIGISPLLIMVLVGSVAFFVLELLYHGHYEGRMRWAMFWFIIPAVLVSRISIEQGHAVASLYGLALASAIGMLIFRLIGPAFGALALLAFIWWCASKLTWDCTLVDDNKDASGEGLLQAADLDAAHGGEPGPNTKDKRRKARAPGKWVVYFSLVALPAFGIGQAVLPEESPGSRTYAFQLLCAYVAAALGLLMNTSFLGLRRYLRQRWLQMPAGVTLSWVGMGAFMAVTILLVALLLPRPDAQWSVPALIKRAQEAAEEASQYAMMEEDAAEGEGRRIGVGKRPEEAPGDYEREKAGQKGRKSKRGQGGDQPDGEGQQEGASTTPGGQGTEAMEMKGGDAQTEAEGGTAPLTMPEPNELATWIGLFVKWLLYAFLVLGALWMLFRQRHRLVAAGRELLARWAAFWSRWFGGGRSGTGGGPSPPHRPFAAFVNPFNTGQAGGMTPGEIVCYTYDALEAWAFEQGLARRPEQTPLEFAASLSGQFPSAGQSVDDVARHYSHVVYAERQPPENAVPRLERVWRFLETTRAEEAVPANA